MWQSLMEGSESSGRGESQALLRGVILHISNG